MRVRVSSKGPARQNVDLSVCFAYQGDAKPRGLVDPALARDLSRQMKVEKFAGFPGDRLIWNANGEYGPRRFLVVGLGPESELSSDAVRFGSAHAAQAAAEFGARKLGLCLPEANASELRAAVEGAMQGAYRYERYIHDPQRRRPGLESIELTAKKGAARAPIDRGQVVSQAVYRARDWVNEGPSRLTPDALAKIARAESKRHGLNCQVMGPTQIKQNKMHALLAVARGSSEPPRVVHLTYRPPGRRPKKRIVLIGKGVTFDSGGLNLKPGSNMLTMKSDMAGAAAVLATMTALGALGCRAEVHGLLGLTENMTGAAAYKPGDIIDTRAGKTVEIGNTDAEGRLVMCDLLSYAADKLKPSAVVDVATLTGACVVALGLAASGLFTRHPELRDQLQEASEQAGEKLWPMPMYDEYLPLLQKGPADLCNVGGRWGGAITAALFLGEFIPRDLPWAHLDIAGPAFTEHDLPHAPTGGTGAAVPTLCRWLESV